MRIGIIIGTCKTIIEARHLFVPFLVFYRFLSSQWFSYKLDYVCRTLKEIANNYLVETREQINTITLLWKMSVLFQLLFKN